MFGFEVAERLTGADKIKLAIALLGVVLILGCAFGAGWAVNGWRKDASHAEIVADLTDKLTACQGRVKDQNSAADLLHEKKVAADDRRKLAKEMSKSVLDVIEAKAAKAADSTATDCDGVLREAHGDAR